MIVLLGLSTLIFTFMGGVCYGAAAVGGEGDDARLPSGWWVLPGAIMGGLLVAAALVWVGL